MGTEELKWGIRATVFAKHVGRWAVSIMDLYEIKVARGAVLKLKKWERDPQNLGEREQRYILLVS